MKTITAFQTEIIGKEVNEAVQLAAESGFKIRVMKRDGVGMVGTMDFRSNRLNVETVADVVMSVMSIG